MPVVPLWHFTSDNENIHNTMRITNGLNNNSVIKKMLCKNNKNEIKILGRNSDWNGCFGIQCMITHDCVKRLQSNFNFLNLVHYIHNRPDRCCFERIFACMICSLYPQLKVRPSLFGNIVSYLHFGYTYEQYINDVKNKQIKRPIIKVWTGR
jgi:hypothetical protein